MKFRYLGGKFFRPVSPSLVQTDGSYFMNKKTGYLAAILHHDSETFRQLRYLHYVRDSFETEMASVYNGLLLSLEKNAIEIQIENDNLGVVRELTELSGKKGRPEILHYKNEIYKLAKETKWTGIRWIPRGENRADDLFR
jgi:ribonuclease HI